MRETINQDYEAIALNALVWVLGDDGRAHRLLDLTGLDGGAIRARLSDPTMLAAVLDFLGAHEPDLVACAAALGHKPETLIEAHHHLAPQERFEP
jgi:Protein of unknown function (DUF3572)